MEVPEMWLIRTRLHTVISQKTSFFINKLDQAIHTSAKRNSAKTGKTNKIIFVVERDQR
jgi:hypothetical protein